MRSLLVPEDKIEDERQNIFTQEEMAFLRSKDYLRRARDYAIFPLSFHRTNRTENIVLHKIHLNSFDPYEYFSELLSELTPPFTILVDWSFLIKKPVSGELRFCFAQRSTSVDIIKVINNDQDIDTFLAFFKNKSDFELLTHVSDNHRRQSAFDESGFNALKLVCCVAFLSKITTLNAPLPF